MTLTAISIDGVSVDWAGADPREVQALRTELEAALARAATRHPSGIAASPRVQAIRIELPPGSRAREIAGAVGSALVRSVWSGGKP
jgi:hypothetical protein